MDKTPQDPEIRKQILKFLTVGTACSAIADEFSSINDRIGKLMDVLIDHEDPKQSSAPLVVATLAMIRELTNLCAHKMESASDSLVVELAQLGAVVEVNAMTVEDLIERLGKIVSAAPTEGVNPDQN